jgi:multidrug efflux pump subunit AcrB
LTYKMIPTPNAVSLGLSKQYLAKQISDALNGSEVLINHQASGKKQTVHVQAWPQHVDSEADLSSLPVHINGQLMVLGDVADWTMEPTPQVYYQYNGLPAVKLRVSLKLSAASSTILRHEIMASARLALEQKFPVKLIDVAAQGEMDVQQKTFITALITALVLVYFVLAWCTCSYVWPIVLLLASLSGASAILWGCLLMRMLVTQWTVIAMLGLGSVLLPQMIMWQKQYREQKKNNPKIGVTEAMVKGLCFQFRPTAMAMIVLSLVWGPLLLSQTSVLQSMRSIASAILLGWYLTTGCMFLGWPALTALYEQYAWRKRLNAN